MAQQTKTVGKTTNASPIKKGGNVMKEDYKRVYKDSNTGATKVYYSNYRYDYRQYTKIKQMAYTIINNMYEQNKAKGHSYKEILETLMRMPKGEVLALLDKYEEKQQLKREARVYQRIQLLDQAEEKANKYFTTIQLKKEQSLIRFIEGIKQGDPKALELFRNMTPEQQEETVNKVDNYLYKQSHQEIEVQLDYIENLGGED